MNIARILLPILLLCCGTVSFINLVLLTPTSLACDPPPPEPPKK